MGDGYGPIVVTREPMTVEDLRGATVAIPGERTTAFLALNLLLGAGSFNHTVMMFDEILDAICWFLTAIEYEVSTHKLECMLEISWGDKKC